MRVMAGVSIAWLTVCLVVLTHTADVGELSHRDCFGMIIPYIIIGGNCYFSLVHKMFVQLRIIMCTHPTIVFYNFAVLFFGCSNTKLAPYAC